MTINPVIRNIVDNIQNKNAKSIKENIEKAISEKATDVLEMKKVKIAKSYFG